MSTQSHIGYARTGETPTRLHRPYKLLPLILVPGIMGSRLSEPGGGLVWNPLGKPFGRSAGTFAIHYDRLQQISSPLVADETSRYDDDALNQKWAPVKHYFNVIADKYDPLLDGLLRFTHPLFDEYSVRLRLYCCGYDWRQDNAKSALRLASVVDEALRDTGAERVIILCHSMGCTVARYYCRVLGGEARVHRLILLGSPTLGAPSAYNYLKIGPPGQYLKDIKTAIIEGDKGAATFELMRSGGAVMQALTNVTTTRAGAIQDMFGSIYLALCLGAGRMLSRKETTLFARLMPALYQLLPTTIFCRQNKMWLIFDPLATGYKPTGFMVILPTLFQAVTEAMAATGDALGSASQRVGDELRNEVKGFLDPGANERTSSRAKRNAITAAELFAAVAKTMEGTFRDWDIGTLVALLSDFWTRAMTEMFLDCRNNKVLYEDIYTGFLDHVPMRAACAGNLALALRLEQALTVRHRFETMETPIELIKNTLGPALALPAGKAVLAVLEDVGLSLAHGLSFGIAYAAGLPLVADRRRERRANDAKGAAERQEKERAALLEEIKQRPRAYMPPQTVNIACKGLTVEGGGILLPLAVISNDDSNIVRYELVPNLVGALAAFLPKGLPHELAMGDGTAPTVSVDPPAEFLSTPFLRRHSLGAIVHGDMCERQDIFNKIADTLIDSLESFAAGVLGIEHAAKR